MKIPAQYRRSVLIAVALHLALLIFLVVRLAPTLYRAPSTYQPKPFDSIKAVAILPTQTNPDKTPDVQKLAQAQAKLAKQAMIQKEQKEQAATAAQMQQQKEEKVAQAKIVQQQLFVKAQLQAAAEEQKRRLKARAQATAQKKAALAAQEKLKMEREFAKANQQKTLRQKALTAKQKQLQQALLQQQLSSEEKDLSQVQVKAQLGRIDKYKAQILALIQSNWRINTVNSKLSCVYDVVVAPDGTVMSATLARSSGDSDLDQSAQQAIMTSSPLPVPQDPALFSHFRQLVLTLSPQGYLSQSA